LLITVEVGAGSAAVASLEQQDCSGTGFAPAFAVTTPATPPWPVGLDLGAGGADAIEAGVLREAVGAASSQAIRLVFVADDGTGSDVLATTDDSGTGEEILLGLLPPDPVQIPMFSLAGLALLLLAVTVLGWLAQRRLGRIGAMSMVLLVAGLAWAMNFMPDGDLADWVGVVPAGQDASGDATDGSSGNDLVAAFAAFENETLYFRIDVADIENQAPTASDGDTTLDAAVPGRGPDADPSHATGSTLATRGSLDLLFADNFESPLAKALTVTTVEDIAAVIILTGIDFEGGGLVFAVAEGPSSGTLGAITQLTPTSAEVTYTPAANFNGVDSFTFTVNDGIVDSASATVSITVDPVNDTPSLTWSTPTCIEDGYCEIQLEAVDSDPADTHTFTITDINTPGLSTLHHYDETQPGNVGVRIESGTDVPDGRLVYVPASNFFGQVANIFAASVEDQGGLIQSGFSVSIEVTAVDDPPLAFASEISLFPHDMGVTPIDVDIAEGQVFNEADLLEVVVVSLPSSGVLYDKATGVEITAAGMAVPCGGSACGDVFTYVLNDGSHTYDSFVDAFEVAVRDANTAAGLTSDPATVSVFLHPPVQTRLLSSSGLTYMEGGNVEMELTFEGAFATSMWLAPLGWHQPPAVSVNDVAHRSGQVYAVSPHRVGGQLDAVWEGSAELVSGTSIPAIEYQAASCTTYTCTFRVNLRACEGTEPSAATPCNPDHSGTAVIPFALTVQQDGDGTGQFGATSAAVTNFELTVDITNDDLDAAPVMPSLDPACNPDFARSPSTGSGFLDSAGNATSAVFQHYWCADAVISAENVYDVSVFGVGARSDGLDVNGDADAWRMEVTFYRAHTGSACAAQGDCVYQRADVPGDDASLSPTPPTITNLSVTLDETEVASLSGLTIDNFTGGYGFTVEHADLLELRRALYYGVYTQFDVKTVPEFDAFQLRLYSRDTGTGTWSEQETEYLLLVRDDSELNQIVTGPDPEAYP
ncbi:Ig-like domain-containing protein, partial [Guyparkeria sp.]|uniref:Ig-like domain-containing protein n=1 Tax=Guyparkeria sp. TaxID=2035736 RepID=UPI0039705C2D